MRAGELFRFLPLVSICLLSGCISAPSPHSRPGTYTVGLHLRGDEYLRKQFELALKQAFVGTNFELAPFGQPDTMLSGTLVSKNQARDRGMSVFRQEITVNGETKNIALCSTTYSDYDAATRDTRIFATDSPEAAREVRALAPKAKIIFLDPAGSFGLSLPTKPAFVNALQEKGFAIVSTPDAPVSDRVTLGLEKIRPSGRRCITNYRSMEHLTDWKCTAHIGFRERRKRDFRPDVQSRSCRFTVPIFPVLKIPCMMYCNCSNPDCICQPTIESVNCPVALCENKK